MTRQEDAEADYMDGLRTENERLRKALTVYATTWPEGWVVDTPDEVWRDPGAVAREAL